MFTKNQEAEGSGGVGYDGHYLSFRSVVTQAGITKTEKI
jgi:hypothetical protein